MLPDNTTLRAWVEEGLSHDAITQRVYEETGHRVSKSAVAVALHRAGMTAPMQRYEQEVPWRVATPHLNEYPVRMLRALGRTRRGLPLPEGERVRYERWIEWLEREGAAVAYDPQAGFFYVRQPKAEWPDGLPVVPGYSTMPEG